MPGTTSSARTTASRSLADRRARLAAAGRRAHSEARAQPEAHGDDWPRVEAVDAEVGRDAVTVHLSDGRAVSFPLAWSPRLLYGTPEERAEVEVSPSGIHWPQLNEDLSVRGILAGRPSLEGPASVEAWRALMDRRRAQIAAGEEPEPHYPTLPLPDWWDEEEDETDALEV